MNTRFYNFARNINHKRKELLESKDDRTLSSVRRIARVHSKTWLSPRTVEAVFEFSDPFASF